MTFDTKKFLNEKFTHRTEDVPVLELKKWFDKDAKPIWTVRELTGKELGHVALSSAKNKSVDALRKLLESSKLDDKTKALEAIFDLDPKSTPDLIAERLEKLVIGSVSPECNLELALKICATHGELFIKLTNAIGNLTGLGMMPGKPKKSMKKQTSD